MPNDNEPIDPVEFARRMQYIADDGDIECGHRDADSLMAGTLQQLGYSDGIAIYSKLPKWYA